MGSWRIRHERAPAGALHAASAAALTGAPIERTVTFMTADAPALVLGSHQDEAAFDRAAMARDGIELARRRSGGSAVLVGAGRVSWVDFVIPSSDPLWDDDVGRAAMWVGELWAEAIAGADVWRQPMRRTDWSAVVCFAGIAPGEVTVAGRKVVGVCQRRTPAGALFQTAALIDWQPTDYLRLLAAPIGDGSELAEAAIGLGAVRVAAAESAIVGGLMP